MDLLKTNLGLLVRNAFCHAAEAALLTECVEVSQSVLLADHVNGKSVFPKLVVCLVGVARSDAFCLRRCVLLSGA